MNRELPAYTRTLEAVRVWKALPEDGRVCTYFTRLFSDDPLMPHPPSDPEDMWWVSYPVQKPKHPEEIPGPDVGDVVCPHCLPQAIYTYWQGWVEANL